MTRSNDALQHFQAPVREWFRQAFSQPTLVQQRGWDKISGGSSTLLLAPTGSGKTLAAFLYAINRLMFAPEPPKEERLKVIYVSPLKALGVDVERNLRAPLAGISATAERMGESFRVPEIAVRSGDTPQNERARFVRHPSDILITTPESLYLLLTSQARERLVSVETLIVDEIHSLVSTKRGAHLFVSLERLEALRGDRAPLQRIGLSATQRPLEVIAEALGGGVPRGDEWQPRPVEIVDAGRKRALELKVEVPVEDMARLAQAQQPANDTGVPAGKSIWPSIYPRLVELIREHRSTLIFVNSRRLAERLALALNETAGAELCLSHHGSVAKDKRLEIEDKLKRGELPALVATSSLELGIDMGAIDLVIQIEAPPSVASGMQRIGRAGHNVGDRSKGVIVPKYRGDLLACAAATRHMLEGRVEETLYLKNPLDVLAQQIVATVALPPPNRYASSGAIHADELFDLMRRSATFSTLPRSAYEGVLDMLSGRYPSDEFAELRARVTWDRTSNQVSPRHGARRVAVVNGGTIPDRGLYGVFLEADDSKKSRRVGELDEEMVFESRPGDVFLLGASSWRILDITHDRVLVAPAPGEPGKMPFWHGDRPGRPVEFGRAIGELSRKLVKASGDKAVEELREKHCLDELAATNLVSYLRDQREATGEVPSDKTVVIERFVDEIGDWRVCVLSPLGSRIHAPWALAITARYQAEQAGEIESLWSDDGMVFRLPESEQPPDPTLFVLDPPEVESWATKSLGASSLFSAHFRENAARALLLPRKRPGQRTPLWAQRKRSQDLLQVASRYPSFPMLLETYRECLSDVFDLPGLIDLMRRLRSREVRLHMVDSRSPSPFSSALLFNYVSNFMYEGDAPLAERRAQALSVDMSQLREILGEAELRELLDGDAIDELGLHLQRLDARPLKHADAVHDLLLGLGDLSEAEISARADAEFDLRGALDELSRVRRIFQAQVGGEARYIASEDAARYRDALGVVSPIGVPEAFLEPVKDALGDLVSRYARTHTPFLVDDVARRLGIGHSPVRTALERLAAADRVLEGEFLPGGRNREWCDREVLKQLKRRSLAKLRQQVEPVEPATLARFSLDWHAVNRPKAGLDAVLDSIEQLQGVALPASAWIDEVLPARVRGFRAQDLDLLCAEGEVVWRGVEPLAPSDGRIALYLTDRYPLLAPPPGGELSELAVKVKEQLAKRGASFFGDLVTATGAFGADVLHALWDLVWAGYVTNDTLAPLKAKLAERTQEAKRRERMRVRFRSRRDAPAGSEGRWTLLPSFLEAPSETERRAALVNVLLERHGVLTREAVANEGMSGGYSAVYPILKAMEESGRVRRGYFVAGLGATQFALPGADDRLRALREPSEEPQTLVLAATDPANPYGASLPWPEREPRLQRAAGALVILHDGHLIGYLARGEKALATFLPEEPAERESSARALARALASLVEQGKRRALLFSSIDSEDPARSEFSGELKNQGFTPSARGLLKRAASGLHARR